MKCCTRCLQQKTIEEFGKSSKKADKKLNQCKKCINKSSERAYQKRRDKKLVTNAIWRASNKQKIADHNRRPEVRYKKAITYAKNRKKSFNLSLEDYCLEITKPCHYCGGAFGVSAAGVGLDRLDNSQGYSKNNVVSCCTHCNRVRGDNLTVKEMLAVVGLLKQLRNVK